jgi:iron complex outermembrane receptor protein
MSKKNEFKISGVSFSKTVLARSVAAALALTASGNLLAKMTIEEVVVTARQRDESTQDIPITIQALTGEQLQKRGLTTLADFARFAPSLNTQSSTPGANTIVFRGVSDGGGFLQDPTAAIYLDEQPMSLTSSAPDIYPVDIARIEALAGPQSTLFGASSSSGAVRIVTNKPNFSEFEGNIGTEYTDTEEGEAGYKLDGTVNIPLIEDKLALRMSAFVARDGGYIDNVLSNSVVTSRAGSGVRNNANVVADDINRVDWEGFRGQVRWQVSDDLIANLSYNYQSIEADGYNDYDSNVGDLETVNFIDEFRDDQWDQMSLVIEADLGFAQLVSATSYYDRDISYQADSQAYVAYASDAFGAYYDFGADPIGGELETAEFSALSQEVRLSASSEKLQWTAGLFYQETEDGYLFNAYAEDYRNSAGFANWSSYLGGLAPTDYWWESGERDNRRTEMAAFGELDYSITDSIDIILGGRWYDVDTEREFFIANPSTAPRAIIPSEGSETGFVPKVGLQYMFNDDVMFYALYSEGFRPGGGNRARNDQVLPLDYEGDILENTEVGFKGTWFDGRLQVNATVYQMTWDNVQVQLTDPARAAFGEQFVNVIGNLGDAKIEGYDFDMTVLLSENWKAGFNLNETTENELTAITSVPDPFGRAQSVPTGLEPTQALPLFPDMSWSAYIEYNRELDWFGGGEGYVLLQHSDTGESLTRTDDTGPSPRYTLPGFAVTDLKLGFQAADWSAQLFINNLADERGITFQSNYFGNYYGQSNEDVIRPRSMGIALRKSF